jgi:hypothetical protein
MDNLNTPNVGEILMYVFIVLFGIVTLYGAYKLTRPFNFEEPKKKGTL